MVLASDPWDMRVTRTAAYGKSSYAKNLSTDGCYTLRNIRTGPPAPNA